ncbi:nucleopolyhedrovirus P10 family protein [Streptomyces demainii]|uniref:Pyruvate/2-oxoglutarate dehydrogenase complex dihydrolipoamide acyltransferase (E2) component n=1 Tax=Streptomyces demainii TaxID=588122 RepID=A0ABT9KR02_9ACTN|nr:nucleopolyhedrovirus P10 family protein [Streptomyces demainii]MDP9610877.1 pyruvate/2-oxoglutarate dehydrogenase complex dihydrolipoamide acyltransferase (E2) component [Streptomyces demainii]
MVTDRLAQTVREQLRLGRLLPLGGREDGSWITERAASEVLGRAAAEVADVRLTTLRIAPADPGTAESPAVPPPPSALPPGPLRIAAECGATPAEPFPATADRLREVLLGAAADRLGLLVEAVDVRVTEVLEAPAEPPRPAPPHHGPQPPPAPPQPQPQPSPPTSPRPPRSAAEGHDPATTAAASAAVSVPGVARLAPVLGSPRAVRIEGAHIRIELAVAAHHRALDVARAVRTAVAQSAPPPPPPPDPATAPAPAPEGQRPTVAVLVTAVDP